MKFLLDTNVYFDVFADPTFLAKFGGVLRQLAPRTYLSSVVLAELLQGAKGELARARIRRGVRALERIGRVVAPDHADWARAAIVQGEIWDRSPALRTKSLLHDALLASCARRIGATVVTQNLKDFQLIRAHLDHVATTPSALLARSATE